MVKKDPVVLGKSKIRIIRAVADCMQSPKEAGDDISRAE